MAEVFDILTRVKQNLGITGEFHDAVINNYIIEVKEFLIGAGATKDVVDAETSAGVITRGVADLWNYGAGSTELSPYFYQRAVQLIYPGGGGENV